MEEESFFTKMRIIINLTQTSHTILPNHAEGQYFSTAPPITITLPVISLTTML